MITVKQLAHNLRQWFDADTIKELRNQLAPAYEEIIFDRGGIKIVEFRCRGVEEENSLIAHLRQLGLGFSTHYTRVNERSLFHVRPRGAIALVEARRFVEGVE